MTFKTVAKSLLERLSKYRLLRVIPVFRLHFHRNESPRAFAQYQQKINELQRTIFFWRYAPSKYKGGLLLNLLGFQILRYFYFNIRYKLRPHVEADKPPKGHLRSIVDSGYVFWPEALTASDIRLLLEFYDKYESQRMNHFEDFSELLIANSYGPIRDAEDYRKIYELIRAVSRYEEVGQSLIGKKLAISPYVAILHYKSLAKNEVQYDGQDIPHSDVCYPSFKAFFYLSDVGTGNGPLTYYKGSQKFSIRRALQEYRDSVQYFAGAKNDIKPMSALEYVQRGGFSEEALTGAAGTGILFNVQGIHRRGDFLRDRNRERKVLLIDFRQVEAGIQRFAA